MAGAFTAVLATACGSSGAAGGAAVTPGTTSATSASPTAAGTTSPPAAVTAAPSAKTAGCLTSGLRATFANGNNAMGGVTGGQLVLTNVSSVPCVTGGFPGVSTVDQAGRQIGAAADRRGVSGGSITLAPGQHAVATVVVTNPAWMTGCAVPSALTTIEALRIYPPENRAALSLPYAATNAVHVQACADPSIHTLTVTALTR
jgi:hypothetical protein